jgi:hypothetical protein
MGVVDAEQEKRMDRVFRFLSKGLEEMVEEEEALKTLVLKNIQNFERELRHVSKELSLPRHEVSKL